MLDGLSWNVTLQILAVVIRVNPASMAAIFLGHVVAILDAVKVAGPSYFCNSSTNLNSVALSFSGLFFMLCSFASFHRERNVLL